MEVIFLGTGTGIPSASRASPSVLILHNDTAILVDCGPGTLRQLARIDIPFNRIDYLFFSHFHPDHTGDLAAYLFASRNRTAFNRSGPARIIGPRGMKELHQNLLAAFGHAVQPSEGKVAILETSPLYCDLNLIDLRVTTFPTPHTPESQGYLFRTDSGSSVAVTGDTDYSPELAADLRGVNLLVTECSFPESLRVEGHLTPFLAGRLAAEAEAEALALNHFYPEVDGRDITSPVSRIYKGHLYLTEDLQKIRL